ncbi:MAG: hypothetical protein WBF47_09425 [Xanthobacteraceae bacterium]
MITAEPTIMATIFVLVSGDIVGERGTRVAADHSPAAFTGLGRKPHKYRINKMLGARPGIRLNTRALEHDPEKVETGFPKRSCSVKMLERRLIQPKAISL